MSETARVVSVAARVLDQLPAAEPVYAVLDGARDPRIRGWVFDQRLPRWCLYRGKLTPELEDAAPWLVSLPRAQPPTEQFFQRFWGRACGILVATALPPVQLRRHLRRFLLAQTEDGKTLIFRYYDPRVLRVYLPTLTAEEAKQFFGGVSAYAAEGAEPGAVHLFRRDEQ